MRALRVFNAVLYVLICFFELPSWYLAAPRCRIDWCTRVRDTSWSLPAWSALTAPYNYHTFGLPVLPPVYTMSISVGCLFGFAAEMWVKYQFMGHRFFTQDYWNIAKVS